jgi:multidrug transporter EmrE-like cation transporter
MPTPAINVTLFAAYVAASSAGLLLLKQSLTRIRATGGSILALTPDSLLLSAGFVLYVVSFVIWLRILSRMPLSIAYPVAIGLTLAFSTAGATLLLGERLGIVRIAGILLIFAGCVALSLEKR